MAHNVNKLGSERAMRVVGEKAWQGDVERRNMWESSECSQQPSIVNSRWDREERNTLKEMRQGTMDASAMARNMGPHSDMRWSGRRAESVGDRKGRSGQTVRHETKQGAIAQQ